MPASDSHRWPDPGGRPTAKTKQSSALVMVVECPSPAVSSTISTLPGGKRRETPSLAVTWYSPRTVT
jgi:hypothetical protein